MRVVDLRGEPPPGAVGAKAARMHWLAAHGYRVPPAWAILFTADDTAGDPLASVLQAGTTYAVRSSANLEDGASLSFAGQFRTELDVEAHEVEAAARRVRASLDDARVGRYLATSGVDPARIHMGVIVQEMATPVVSGAVFSRHPMTGLSETIVEAVAGRGDALLAGGVTPQRWVYRWGDCVEAPDEWLLDAPTVEEIVETAARVDAGFGAPVDLEWVWDGTAVHWVQLRAITGLDAVDIYSRRIAKEVMPGVIKPLVWSVNVPLVNSAWIDLFTQVIGPNELKPEDLARSFAYRAYFNMGTIGRIFDELGMPRETLELLLGFEGSKQPTFRPTRRTLAHLPRMALAAARLLRYGREVDALLADLEPRLEEFGATALDELDDWGVLADIDRLDGVMRRAAAVNIVVPLLMNAYYGGLRRRLARRDVDIARLDLAVRDVQRRAYDPAPHLDRLHERLAALAAPERLRVRAGGYEALADHGDLRSEIDEFIARFGHFSDSGNDFSVVPWREDPDRVVRMVADHRPAPGDDTRIRWHDVIADANATSRALLTSWYRRARDYRAHRDAVSFQYTRGYGLFRDRFVELGRRLVDRGVLADTDDVWYLELAEVRRLVAGERIDARSLAARRRAEIDSLRQVTLPDVIFGDEFVPAPPSDAAAELRGIPTSRGVYRGPIRVVEGRPDFDAVAPGDVLVIPFSDVGWTPLFARAGAVVAESGGMLSHSSIVAREYGIPCVVSVPDACTLPTGATAVVDGYTGAVTLEGPEE